MVFLRKGSLILNIFSNVLSLRSPETRSRTASFPELCMNYYPCRIRTQGRCGDTVVSRCLSLSKEACIGAFCTVHAWTDELSLYIESKVRLV